jgi:hypothetical protein
MALVRTDYGLIYNDDGSLCATLLPEGGVAVEEGTENLIPVANQLFKYGVGWSTYMDSAAIVTQDIVVPEWRTNKATRLQLSGGTNRIKYYGVVSTDTAYLDNKTFAVQVLVKNIGQKTVEVGANRGFITDNVLPGEVKKVKLIVPAIVSGSHLQIQFRTLEIEDSLDLIVYQPMAEEGSYCTSFTEGTRLPGALPYSTSVISGMNEIAVLIKAKRPVHSQAISYLFSASTDPLQSPYANTFVLRTTEPTNGLYFWTVDPLGENSDQLGVRDIWLDDEDHDIVVYMNHNPAPGRHKKELYFDGELIGYADPASLPDLSAIDHFNIGTWGSKTMWWGSPIKMFCIKPTCTLEQVKAWHSLDAPFFDPREQIDAGARPVSVQGTGGSLTINNQGEKWVRASDGKAMYFFDVNNGDAEYAGRLVAGDGRIVSDEDSLRTYDKPYTDPTAIKQVEIGTDGALTFGAGAGRADAQGLLLYDISDPNNPKIMVRLVGETGSADFEGMVKAKTLVIPVGTNRWG